MTLLLNFVFIRKRFKYSEEKWKLNIIYTYMQQSVKRIFEVRHVIYPTKKEKKSTCPQMVATLHSERFVAFYFNPSLRSRLFTDSDFDRIKWIFGHKMVGNLATDLYSLNSWNIWSKPEKLRKPNVYVFFSFVFKIKSKKYVALQILFLVL